MADEQGYEDDFDHGEESKDEPSAYVDDFSNDAQISSTVRTVSSVSKADWMHAHERDIVLGKRIGGGGFAVVHAATYLGSSVAVKTMVDVSAEARAEFDDELHSLSRARHAGVARLIAACLDSAQPCLIMELCGPSLYAVIHEGATGVVPGLSVRLSWCASLAHTVAHLHSLTPALIHRDIKSQNVLLPPAGSPPESPVRLVDFGLSAARVIQAGTPASMAPELLQGRPHGRPADVYALGTLIWEAVTCRHPHAGRTPADLIRWVPNGERPPINLLPPGCPPALQSLIESCWAGEAAVRPTATQVASGLDSIASVAGTMLSGGPGGRPQAAHAPVVQDALDNIMRPKQKGTAR